MAVRLHDVNKSFMAGSDRIAALDGVNLEISDGEFACLYGASGSGKTTLLNVIAGIELPDSGDILVASKRVHAMSESARADLRLQHIGVIFQANNLLPELSGIENVALPLVAQGRSLKEASRMGLEAMGAVGLSPTLAGRLPGKMSGGQRQRVGIARALAGNREILLADEPTGALDAETSRALFALLRELVDARSMTVVLATHDPLARGFADTTYDMLDGKITQA